MTAATKTPGFMYLDANGPDQWVEMDVGGGPRDVSLSVGGSFVASVTLQRKRQDQGNGSYKDLFSTGDPAEKVVQVVGPCRLRAGVKTGEYVSGTAEIELGG